LWRRWQRWDISLYVIRAELVKINSSPSQRTAYAAKQHHQHCTTWTTFPVTIPVLGALGSSGIRDMVYADMVEKEHGLHFRLVAAAASSNSLF